MREIGRFWDQSQHFLTFLYICSLDFLKLYLMTSIKILFKVTVLDFKGKFMLCLKWVKWVIFGLIINRGSSLEPGVHYDFILV